MDITLSRDLLTKAVLLIEKAADKSQPADHVLAHIRLHAVDGKLHLSATDTTLQLSTSVDASVQVEGVVSCPAQLFFDALKVLPTGTQVRLMADKMLSLECASSKFDLPILVNDTMPRLAGSDTPTPVRLSRQHLIELITRTRFCMADAGDTRHYLIATLFHVEQDKLTCVATDGHRLALDTRPLLQPCQTQKVIIPKKAVEEMLRLYDIAAKNDKEDREAVLLLGNHALTAVVEFEGLSVELVSRFVEGNYPDYLRVIPQECTRTAMLDGSMLDGALKKVQVLGRDAVLSMSFGEHLSLSAHTSRGARVDDTLALEYEGEPMTLAMNVGYLRDVLAVLGARVRLGLNGEVMPVLIQNADVGDERYVVMPIRL